ncbi:hypothetical protein ACKI1I_35095 [Streptomyces turgidiscabies]|uniref:Uncharacterized protein n=1 Tax=Streptomyces turgidiscabies (strain Car8) TaxID=698760 RepID=L7EYZ4_STRT8|nr:MULTISPECIES: hypothetical protein [Streptomyces]ELP64247.1 hypothetical protein STRTUCAR8_04619 [Streptomyces turgidiscabies Car8]MDX3495705.1 hypothetical protein [Streptomyces turgidiscabies]GAQ75521.1 hypothetical protein T45_07306 [Streptomyces turgidiscabies]
MSELRECGIVCPTDWVPLAIEPTDNVKRWARSTAADLRERSRAAGYDIEAKVLEKDLRAQAEDSRRRDPFYAFALYPDGFDSALATLEIDLIHPDASVPRITLDWLAETFSAHDFGPPLITRTEVPIGPAVRIRQNFATAAASSGGPGVLLETLMYGVLPTGAESALVFLMSWTVPGIAEEMEEVAAGIVKTLSVAF